MTLIVDYVIAGKTPTDSGWKNFFKSLTFQEKNYIFEVELRMDTSVGYTPNNLLILDNYVKVVVIQSDGIIVRVKTIKPSKEFKPTKGVLSILTRKWGGN